jgi:hypothetical protein
MVMLPVVDHGVSVAGVPGSLAISCVAGGSNPGPKPAAPESDANAKVTHWRGVRGKNTPNSPSMLGFGFLPVSAGGRFTATLPGAAPHPSGRHPSHLPVSGQPGDVSFIGGR